MFQSADCESNGNSWMSPARFSLYTVQTIWCQYLILCLIQHPIWTLHLHCRSRLALRTIRLPRNWKNYDIKKSNANGWNVFRAFGTIRVCQTCLQPQYKTEKYLCKNSFALHEFVHEICTKTETPFAHFDWYAHSAKTHHPWANASAFKLIFSTWKKLI